jgi:hypothetical protein
MFLAPLRIVPFCSRYVAKSRSVAVSDEKQDKVILRHVRLSREYLKFPGIAGALQCLAGDMTKSLIPRHVVRVVRSVT